MPKRARSSNETAASSARAYGTDEYWIGRYDRRSSAGANDDETDEWLLGAEQLGPLLKQSLPRDAACIDIGCGTSTLVFDLLRDTLRGDASRALAVDIAPAALEALAVEQRARVRRGETSARRASLLCADLTKPPTDEWLAACGGGLDVTFDKSTTDGMMCDPRRGAGRVRVMYEAIGAVLRPAAVVVVVSWRAPEDGLEWLVDAVLGGLRQREQAVEAKREDALGEGSVERSNWRLDIHSMMAAEDDVDGAEAAADEAAEPPHVYILTKRPKRALRRARAAAEAEESVTVRQHWHEH